MENTLSEMPPPTDIASPETFARIFERVRAIPPGRVMGYGEVGLEVGETARTVGWALSLVPDEVPWQRVVGADGYLRIGRRSPHLKAKQKELLTSEGVRFDDKDRVLKEFFLSHEGAEEMQNSLFGPEE